MVDMNQQVTHPRTLCVNKLFDPLSDTHDQLPYTLQYSEMCRKFQDYSSRYLRGDLPRRPSRQRIHAIR